MDSDFPPYSNGLRSIHNLGVLTSGNLTYIWKITIFNGKTHYKWPFSIAMLVCRRVTYVNHFQAHSTAESSICFAASGYRALDWAALSDFNETVVALKRGGKSVEAKWELHDFGLGTALVLLVG
jgi:hypothetical protein